LGGAFPIYNEGNGEIGKRLIEASRGAANFSRGVKKTPAKRAQKGQIRERRVEQKRGHSVGERTVQKRLTL